MNGLEQILLKIENDNKENIEAILSEAQKEKEKIISLATEEANKEAGIILKEAKDKEQRIKENADSLWETKKRESILSAKSSIIEKWIAQSEKEFLKISDEEYFKIIKKLILKCSAEGEGEILFSKEDKEKMPSGFLDEVNMQLSSKNACVVLSEENLDTEKGFIIRYGLIEENCTFKAIMEENLEEIKDRLFLLLKDVEEV